MDHVQKGAWSGIKGRSHLHEDLARLVHNNEIVCKMETAWPKRSLKELKEGITSGANSVNATDSDIRTDRLCVSVEQ